MAERLKEPQLFLRGWLGRPPGVDTLLTGRLALGWRPGTEPLQKNAAVTARRLYAVRSPVSGLDVRPVYDAALVADDFCFSRGLYVGNSHEKLL